MKYELLEGHQCENETPIELRLGDRVKLGEMSDENGNWPNWIYCYALEGESQGWTPIQIIKVEGDYGIALEDYSAKELSVEKGELVFGNRILNGWVWCSTAVGAREGWLPTEKLKKI